MGTNNSLVAALAKKQQPLRAIYISSYIPRKCGIARFTKDLTTAINNLNPYALAEIIAVLDYIDYNYPWEVKFRIRQDTVHDYSSAAHYIKQSSADVISLQHEFGLFGGVEGDYILPLLDSIDKPLVTTFHTIMPEPDDHKTYIMRRIIERSAGVVAMTESSRQILIDVYGCPPKKTAVIYHGVPDFTFDEMVAHKKRLRIKAQPMILTAGLLGPGKGLEYVIDSMSQIAAAYPGAMLYIIGQTHPHLIHHEGERYRDSLKKRVRANGLAGNVRFINRYVPDDEYAQYYQAADFFVNAHLDTQQAASGTLAQAMGAGKLCIATPFHYAREMLSDGSGVLVEPRDGAAIAKAILYALRTPKRTLAIRRQAYQKGRQMIWSSIGLQYLDLFRLVVQQKGD